VTTEHDYTDRDQEPLILLIINAAELENAIKQALHRAGYRTISAEDDVTGIAIAEKFTPHAVLLDTDLPGSMGNAICQELKSRLPTADIPVLFLTSLSPTEEVIRRCFDAGAHDLIVKPDDPSAEFGPFITNLLSRIRVVLREQDLREAYRRLATQDSQTGLENRRQCFLRISDAIMTSKREKTTSVLILGDIDKIGTINNRFGYDFGDEVILTFARLLKRFISPDCKAGRIASNTMAVVLKNSSRDRGLAFCRRIAETFAAIAFDADTDPKHFSLSFGLSSYEGTLEQFSPDEFMSQADMALYEAKDRERNRICAYWDLDAASLPLVAPDKRHARRKQRRKSNRTYVGVTEPRPDPSLAQQ